MYMRGLAGIIFAVLLCAPAAPAQTRDDFDGSALKPFWTILREQSDHWRLSEGYLEITTQPGALNTTEYNNVRNTFLQPVPPDSTMRMETFLLFTPVHWYHNAGLIYRIDDDNYIRVSRGIYPDVNGVWMEWEVDGETNFHFVADHVEDYVYLRLSRTEDSVFAATYSSDAMHWYEIGTEVIHFPATAPMGGVQAANGEGLAATGGPLLARFDYFGAKVTSVPARPSLPSSLAILTVHPTPARIGQSAEVTLRLDRPATLHWWLTDLLGRRVGEEVTREHLDAGTHGIGISLHGVPPGIYFMHVMAAGSRATQRILLTR
ncbi:MAG: hypothetical protein RRA94_04695 [Bacteroidota bacterium]|nr:hypothetical protein [Bacteroidota bacterium]